mgnify:FL=1
MTFYIDTADIKIIKENISHNFCDGVTTNPSILSKIENLDYYDQVKKIKTLCKKNNND